MYSRSSLLQLRADVTASPPCKVKRRLWFQGILRPRSTCLPLEHVSTAHVGAQQQPLLAPATECAQRSSCSEMAPDAGSVGMPIPVVISHRQNRPILRNEGSIPRDLVQIPLTAPVKTTRNLHDLNFVKPLSNLPSVSHSNLIKIPFTPTPRKPKSSFVSPSVLYFNARSLKNKIDELSMRCKRHNPDVIVITETWFDPCLPDSLFSIDGYNLLRCDRNSNGGGIALFLRHTLSYQRIDIASIPNVKSNFLCCMLPELSIIFFCIYHPYWGSSSTHRSVLEHLQDSFDGLVRSHGSNFQFTVCGDVNGLSNHLPSFFLCNNLTQLINFSTCGDNTIDIFATTKPSSYVQPSRLSSLGRSDHAGYFVQSVGHPQSVSHRKVYTRDFSQKNHNDFLFLLHLVNWPLLLNHSSLDIAISNFNDVINYFFDLCFPIKVVRMRPNDPPWMTPFIKLLFDRMDHSFFHNRGRYLIHREEYLRQVSNAKSKFSKSLFADAHNPKLKWKVIKQLSKKSPCKPLISDELADELNTFFSSSFVPSNPNNLSKSFQCHSTSSQPPRVSEFDVFKQLRSIRSSGNGHDLIKGWVLKRYAHEFAAPLTLLYNRCFQECYFPNSWKLANINPIPKGRSSYRPISLLPSASKVLEKLFVKHFLIPSIHSSFNPFQFGFLPTGFGGCTNATTYVRLDILRHLSTTSGSVRCVQIDLEKAFDKASHHVILSSLREYVSDSSWILSFVLSFLTNRWQRVISSSYSSAWVPVTSGVPQGSVLGPILFALIINKFPALSENSKMIAYADDLIILHRMSVAADDRLQSDLDTVLHWLSTLELSFNRAKFKTLTFSRNPSPLSPLLVGGQPLPEVDDLKFLGVLFQSDAKVDRHFSSIIGKANRNLYFVKLLWLNKAPSKIIWEAYLSFVFSCFSYCWPAVCDIPSTYFQKICSLERRACKWAGTSFCLSSLRSRLDSICIRLAQKISKLHDSHPLAHFFDVRSPVPGLRHTRILQLPPKAKAFFRNSFIRYGSFT